MTLCPDPVLAERLLLRWCPVGHAVRVAARRQPGRAVHLEVNLDGVPVTMPIGIQVSDLLGRDLDRYGAIRLRPRETAGQLVAALALRLHGDGRALRLAPVAVAMRVNRQPRRCVP